MHSRNDDLILLCHRIKRVVTDTDSSAIVAVVLIAAEIIQGL